MLEETNGGKTQANVYDNGGGRRVSNETASTGRRVSVESKYKIVSQD